MKRALKPGGPRLLSAASTAAWLAMVAVHDYPERARLNGLSRNVHHRFDRLDDRTAALHDKMEKHFDKAKTHAQARHDLTEGKADARFHRSQQQAGERLHHLLAIASP